MTAETTWWVFSNRHGGARAAWGATAKEAREWVVGGIVEAFLSEGLSPSAARRGAASYRLRLIAGPLPQEEAAAVADHWDWSPGQDWAAARRSALAATTTPAGGTS